MSEEDKDTDTVISPDLLTKLQELVTRITSHGGVISDSMVERYSFFISHSDKGKDCSYARKCKDLFLRYDYEEVSKLFLEVLEQFRLIEGEQYGQTNVTRSDK